MKQEKQVLVIFPHPDDEAFGVSGTIASYTKAGIPVTYMCLTLGEMGRNLGNPPFATRESLPNIRRQELKKAASIMGIKDLRMMGLRDKTIEFEDDKQLVSSISSVIDELKPSLVISFYPGYSVHPDHDATGRAVVRALEKIEKEKRPTLYAVAFSQNCIEDLGEADVIHDVKNYISIKLDTLKAHASQTQLITGPWEEKLKQGDKEILEHLGTEKFWTYKWEK